MPEGCIAFYSTSVNYGGIERNIVRQAAVLKDKGFNILLVFLKETAIAKTSEKLKVEIIQFNDEKITSLRALTRKLIEKDVKVIILSKPRELKSGFIIKIFSGFRIKIVYSQQENINFNKNRLFKSLLLKWTDFWLTPNFYLSKKIENNRFFKHKDVRVVPHCMDLSSFLDNEISKDEARNNLNLPKDRRIIGIMGSQTPEKKQDFVIRDINFLKINDYTFDLLIMGNPKRVEEQEYSQFLKELTLECGLDNQVHFRKYADDIMTFYRSIDVFVKTTSGEACDTTTIEALAAGTPVLSVYSEYNAEILENGNLGMLYKNNDLEDFSTKLIKILSRQKIIDHLKDEGIKAVNDKYDINHKTHKIELIARELLR